MSRCQRFDFRKIPTRQIADRLLSICKAENVKFTEESIWLIARQAEGSMRDSQSLLDQAITFTNADLDSERIIDILGLTDRSLIRITLESLVARDPQRAMQVVEKLFLTGFDSRVYINELLEEIRHLLLIKLNPEQLAQVVDLPDSEIAWLKELSTQLTSEDIHLLFDMALKGASDLVRAQTPRIVLEMILLRMVEAPRVVEIETLLRGGGGGAVVARPPNARVEQKSVTAPVPATATAPVNTKLITSDMPAQAVAKAATANASTSVVGATEADAGLKIPNFALNLKSKNGAPGARVGATATASSAVVATPAGSSSTPTSVKAAVETAPVPAAAHEDVNAPAKPPVPRMNAKVALTENWATLVEYTRTNYAQLGAKLEYVAILSADNGVLKLAVKPAQEFLVNQLKEPRTLGPLRDLTTQFFGKTLEIEFEITRKGMAESMSPKASEEKKQSERTQEVQSEVENHPLVKKAKALFESQIIEIKENRS